MAPPFYPAADTVESVVEKALDDLNLDDFDVSELEKELNNASPVSASFGDSLLSISPMMSAPVSIPGSVSAGSPHSYTPQSPTSPLGHFSSSYSSSPMTGQTQKVSSCRINQDRICLCSGSFPPRNCCFGCAALQVYS